MNTSCPYRPTINNKPVLPKPLVEDIVIGFVLLLTLLFFPNNAIAQVRTTGHVFAEIVEPTALTAITSNEHFINENRSRNETNFVLAEVKLSGGTNMNIDFSIQSSHLEAANGEVLPFDAFICPGCQVPNPAELNTKKIFTLKGNIAENIRLKKNNTFMGQYRVVFMYN
ncbi:MAG: hypothetical protein ACP5D9_16130 [Mariniphaga sp.]